MALEYDLVIVGGGMVGLTLAANLAVKTAESMKIALIESAAEPVVFNANKVDPRVVALSRRSQSILDNAGVWPAIRDTRICPYSAMRVWDAEGTGEIDFDAQDSGDDFLGAIVENSLIVSELTRKIDSCKNIHVFRGQAVEAIYGPVSESGKAKYHSEPGSVKSTVTISGGSELSASMVIAADGAQSPLRNMLGLQTREWDYNHTAIVATVQTEKPHQHTAWQSFAKDGPLAFLPLSLANNDHCSIVWSIESARAESLMALDDNAFCHALGLAIEHRLGKILGIDKRYAIPLRQRHSKRYILPGFALVGDAAHTIHPLAGQGANLGLYDSEVLAEEICRAQTRGVKLTDFSILKRYERQRQGHNLMAMAAMEGFKRLFGSDDLVLRWLRNQGMNMFNQQALIKQQLSRIASGL